MGRINEGLGYLVGAGLRSRTPGPSFRACVEAENIGIMAAQKGHGRPITEVGRAQSNINKVLATLLGFFRAVGFQIRQIQLDFPHALKRLKGMESYRREAASSFDGDFEKTVDEPGFFQGIGKETAGIADSAVGPTFLRTMKVAEGSIIKEAVAEERAGIDGFCTAKKGQRQFGVSAGALAGEGVGHEDKRHSIIREGGKIAPFFCQ
jgi:hypothetical protein